MEIEPFELTLLRDAETDRDLDEVHHDQRADEGRAADGRAADRLSDELVHTAAVEEAGDDRGRRVVGPRRRRRAVLAGREEAERERSPDASGAVDGNRTDRIVDPEVLHQVDAERADRTGDGA